MFGCLFIHTCLCYTTHVSTSRTTYIIVIILVLGTGLWYWNAPEAEISPASFKVGNEEVFTPETPEQERAIAMPLSRASERITKKPFGIKITPQISPVQPERFSGFHTGTDFETFPEEQGEEVAVFAICAGKLAVKRIASGYGGVLAQNCILAGEPVAVVYGHIALGSVTAKVGDELKSGEQIAALGEPGIDTDGERKHLHLGIHKGSQVDIRGYVQNQSELGGWLDFSTSK